MNWIVRECADSSHRADTIEKSVRLAKPIDTSPTGAFLADISKRA